jgi:DNA-binding MarR family transcriptional regulator
MSSFRDEEVMMQWSARATDLLGEKSATLLVFTYLLHLAGDPDNPRKGFTIPAKRLEKYGVDSKEAERALRELEAEGFIRVSREPHRKPRITIRHSGTR